jgi:hypothetical protein
VITTGSYKPEFLMRMVAKHVQGEPLPSKVSFGSDGLLYLGGGYWRLKQVRDEHEKVVGVTLINPDKTGSDIEVVERAIAVLIGSVEFRGSK